MDIQFGEISGVRVGQCFSDRKALREAGVHAPLMQGILGQKMVLVRLSYQEGMKTI